jgi:hypothetical protein
MELKEIITEGELKTYYFGASFIEVYWSHPSLEEGVYYRFLFTASKESFVSVTAIRPLRGLYIKRKPKIMLPHAISLVKNLIED